MRSVAALKRHASPPNPSNSPSLSPAAEISELVIHLPQSLRKAGGDAADEAVGDLGVGDKEPVEAVTRDEPDFRLVDGSDKGAGRAGVEDTDLAERIASFQHGDTDVLVIYVLEYFEPTFEQKVKVVIFIPLFDDDVSRLVVARGAEGGELLKLVGAKIGEEGGEGGHVGGLKVRVISESCWRQPWRQPALCCEWPGRLCCGRVV